jgi:hypothetical protein
VALSTSVPESGTSLDDKRSGALAAAADGRAWLAALPAELSAQRHLMAGLLDYSEATPSVTALLVGCSLGRGAADALSDIDGAMGVQAEAGAAGAAEVLAVEAGVVAALPDFAPLVDILRHRYGPADRFIRRIFAQFGDRSQLDLTIMADAELRGGAAVRSDTVWLYDAARQPAEPAPGQTGRPGEPAPGYAVTGEQIREWAFLGWCALIDMDKYLRRGSLWEAHIRLHHARDHIWALWAAATGALYPWHGLTQVLDNDPGNLPPGVDATVAGLDAADLRRAATASAALLTWVSTAAAERCPAELPSAMARYVTGVLSAA